MAFLCPVRIKKNKRKGVPPRKLETPLPGRITGSDSIDTLVRVNYEKDRERGPRARMVVVHNFVPCVDDELAVKRNQQVQVLYQENDWLYVLTENGREGFIPYTYCLPVERSVDDFVLPKSKRSYLTQDVCDHAKHDNVPQSNLQKTESKSMPDICGQDKEKSARNKRTETNSGYATVRNHNQRHLINHTQEVNNSYNSNNNDRQWHSEDSNITHDYYNLMPHVTSNERPVSNNSSYKELNQNSSMSSGGTNSSIQNQSAGYKSETQSANRNRTKYNPQHKFNSLRSQPFYQPHESNDGSIGNFRRSHSLNISQAPVNHHHHHRQHSLPDDNQHNQSFESCVSTHFAKKSYGQYIVLFNYTPRQENDVAVKRGEFVTLLNKDDEDWYWIRRSDAIEGFVPKTFLCPAEGQEDSSVSSSQTLPRRYQPTRSNHKPQQLKDNKTSSFPNQRATKLLCLYDYTAKAPDDLTVTRGQWLYSDLANQTDSEWLWAYSTQTNKSGFIPRTHAKLPNFTSYPNTSTHNDPLVSP